MLRTRAEEDARMDDECSTVPHASIRLSLRNLCLVKAGDSRKPLAPCMLGYLVMSIPAFNHVCVEKGESAETEIKLL